MRRQYKLFFFVYSFSHVLAGMLIILNPKVLSPILFEIPNQGSANLVGMLSIMMGLGFYGAGYVSETKTQIFFVRLAALSNLVNLGAHLGNAYIGASSVGLAYLAFSSVALILAFLFWLQNQLYKEE